MLLLDSSHAQCSCVIESRIPCQIVVIYNATMKYVIQRSLVMTHYAIHNRLESFWVLLKSPIKYKFYLCKNRWFQRSNCLCVWSWQLPDVPKQWEEKGNEIKIQLWYELSFNRIFSHSKSIVYTCSKNGLKSLEIFCISIRFA